MSVFAYVVRLAGYALLLVAIGSVTFSYVARASRATPSRVAALHIASAGAGFCCMLAFVPVALARLYLQLDSMRFPDEPLLQSLRPLISATHWGPVWGGQFAMCIVAALAFRRAEVSPRWLWVTSPALVLVAGAYSLSGHAAAASDSHVARVVADATHIVAAGTWFGALLLLAWVARAVREARDVAAIVHTFSPVALASAGVLAFTGAFGAFAHVPTVDALFETPYGKTLLVKLALFGAVLVVGWINWKRNTPRILTDDAASLRRGTAAELGFAVAALLVTAALVVTPPPAE